MKQTKYNKEVQANKIAGMSYTSLLSRIESLEMKIHYEQLEGRLVTLQRELDMLNAELKSRKK